MARNKLFIDKQPQIDDYWRGIILYGRNVASYKFALAKALLELNPQSGQLIKLDELAIPYAKHITEHLKLVDKQGTPAQSRFLDACRKFNNKELTHDELIGKTVSLGFVNVVDAFHTVGRKQISRRFFIDERSSNKGIKISDDFSMLTQSKQIHNLEHEVESRWRLVETAWEMGVSRNLLTIGHDSITETLFARKENRRKVVTSCRGALNGYQKGICFYCFSNISIDKTTMSADVDHFFPHTLKKFGFGNIVDGIWNLVLTCQNCNRGPDGKFDHVPSLKLLERLHFRNEYLIASHHPLRETIMKQTGATEMKRRIFLNNFHNNALSKLIHSWEPLI